MTPHQLECAPTTSDRRSRRVASPAYEPPAGVEGPKASKHGPTRAYLKTTAAVPAWDLSPPAVGSTASSTGCSPGILAKGSRAEQAGDWIRSQSAGGCLPLFAPVRP